MSGRGTYCLSRSSKPSARATSAGSDAASAARARSTRLSTASQWTRTRSSATRTGSDCPARGTLSYGTWQLSRATYGSRPSTLTRSSRSYSGSRRSVWRAPFSVSRAASTSARPAISSRPRIRPRKPTSRYYARMSRPADGITEFLGFTFEGPGRIRLTVRPELINFGGLLSGVVPFAMLDYAMGSALWPHVGDDEAIATLNLSINYVATAREGDIVCRAELERRNRRAATLTGRVETDGGRLLASAIGAYSIFPRRSD